MRAVAIVSALVLVSFSTFAQQPAGQNQPAPTPKTAIYASAADVAAAVVKMGDQVHGNQRMLQLPPYGIAVEHRTGVDVANIHETDAEIYYIIDGTATLVTGGKLVDEKRTNPANLAGNGVEGGSARQVGKGDIVFIPEGVVHYFSAVQGVTYMSMHVPRPLPQK